MKPLLIMVLVLAILPSTLALETQRTEISISDSGRAGVANLFYLESAPQTFSIPAFSPQSIRVYDSSQSLQFNQSPGEIRLLLPSSHPIPYSFTAEYQTDSLTSKNGSIWTVSYDYYRLRDFNPSVLTFILPENSKLLSSSPGGIIYSENGIIKIDWDLTSSASSRIFATYSIQIPPEHIPLDFPVYLLIPAAIVIGLAGFFLSRSSGPALPTPKNSPVPNLQNQIALSPAKTDILKTLAETEKKIITELMKHPDGLMQKKLMLNTGIPKATLSRTLKKLQSRQLLELRNYGNTNLILLTEWFRSK